MKEVAASEAFDSKEVRIFVCLGYEASSKMEAFVFWNRDEPLWFHVEHQGSMQDVNTSCWPSLFL